MSSTASARRVDVLDAIVGRLTRASVHRAATDAYADAMQQAGCHKGGYAIPRHAAPRGRGRPDRIPSDGSSHRHQGSCVPRPWPATPRLPPRLGTHHPSWHAPTGFYEDDDSTTRSKSSSSAPPTDSSPTPTQLGHTHTAGSSSRYSPQISPAGPPRRDHGLTATDDGAM